MDSLALPDQSREGLAALCLDEDEVKNILDHPKLFEALTWGNRSAMVSLELFFFVVVRHALKRVGVKDLAVADYIAVVCADHGLPQQVGPSGSPRHAEKLYSLDYLHELDNARGSERFFVHVQCANQFLVLTCLFPTFLQHRAQRRGAPDVTYYERFVAAHLEAAGRHALADEFALAEVLLRLSNDFPPVRRAMNHLLQEYLSLG